MRSNAVRSSALGPRRRRAAGALDSHLVQLFLRDMRGPAPALLPIFRSRLQGELLARLLVGARREVSMLDLAVMLRTDLASVHREVHRLARAGILSVRRVGPGRVVGRNPDSPLYESLARLVMLTFGPAVVVAEEFGRLPGVHDVCLFGTWAERYEGAEGELPQDIDVLVIGDVARSSAFAASLSAQERLGLQVTVVVRTPAQWRSTDDPFVRQIRDGPLLTLSLHRFP